MIIKRRSPNYPSIDLQEAVNVVATLYQGSTQGRGVGRGEFTPQDAAAAWGYASTAGPVKNRVAALRQYGMLEGKKGGNPTLSDRALTLILRDPGASEHREALRATVSGPDIFEELRRTMPNAADDALRQHLIVQRNFTREGADRLIVVFRASIAYAGTYEYDNITAQDRPEDNEDNEEGIEVPPSAQSPAAPTPPVDPGTRSVTIPLPGTSWATLQAPFPLSTATWEQMLTMLDALKPGLTSEELEPSGADDE